MTVTVIIPSKKRYHKIIFLILILKSALNSSNRGKFINIMFTNHWNGLPDPDSKICFYSDEGFRNVCYSWIIYWRNNTFCIYQSKLLVVYDAILKEKNFSLHINKKKLISNHVIFTIRVGLHNIILLLKGSNSVHRVFLELISFLFDKFFGVPYLLNFNN